MRRLNLVSPAHKDSIRTSPVAEPMSEEIVTSKRRNGQRNWVAMSDPQLITFATEFMMERRITTRWRLAKADSGLYAILRIRNLLSQIEFEEVKRDWITMTDQELVRFAREFLKENGITTREGLKKADSGVYAVLRRRNLLGQVIPEPTNELHRRDWIVMNDERIVEFTQEFMKENGITTRSGLKKADNGLYLILKKRNLRELVGFEEVRRGWTKLSDLELITVAKEIMKEKGITTRGGLKEADRGLHAVLRKRSLLERSIPESKHEGYRERRDWTAMTDPELIEFTQEFMKENGITTREGLQKADSGLHTVLKKRDLLPQIEFEEVRRKERNWAMMSDKELVRAAQEFTKEKGITTRRGLRKTDSGLESVLKRRKLLDQVGFEEVRRDWESMTDQQLITFATEFMIEREITTRWRLAKADPGLDNVLRRRKLLDRVFAEIDEKRHEESLDAVCEALEEFGEDG